MPSESDFGRASVAQVGEWLAVVAKQDRKLTLLCWLLWLTGMPLKRLLLARVDSKVPTGMSPAWNPLTAQLSYVVEHYKPAGRSEPQVMRLQCPAAWTEHCLTLRMSDCLQAAFKPTRLLAANTQMQGYLRSRPGPKQRQLSRFWIGQRGAGNR